MNYFALFEINRELLASGQFLLDVLFQSSLFLSLSLLSWGDGGYDSRLHTERQGSSRSLEDPKALVDRYPVSAAQGDAVFRHIGLRRKRK